MPVTVQDPNDNAGFTDRKGSIPGGGQFTAVNNGLNLSPQQQTMASYWTGLTDKAAAANPTTANMTPQQLDAWLYSGESTSGSPQQAFLNGINKQGIGAAENYLMPTTGFDKWAPLAITGVSLAGIGGGFAAGLAPALGAAGAGAVGGVASGALSSGLNNGANLGKDIALGAIGGGIAGGLAPGASQGVQDVTGLSSTASNIIARGGLGAASGAATAAIGGGNPLQAAVSGGLGGAASAGLGAAGVGGAASSFLGNEIGNFAGQQFAGQPGGAASAGQQNMIGGGSINPQQSQFGGLGSSLGGLFGAGMGIAANNQQSNLQQNAYTTAGNAANYNPFNFSGLGGLGSSFSNGTGTLSAGGFNPSAFQGLTNTALGSAGQYAGGGLPQGVASAGNNLMSALGGAQGNAQTGAAGGMSMFGAGANLVGGANGTYNSAYNNSLSAAQQALQQPFQQQTNALRNQQFETGMSGTSGGALQTQALATGQGQAELQAQQNAVSQANSAQSIALGYGSNLMNSGLGQFGNFNQQGAGFAGQGLNAQMGLGSYSPQLSSLYANLANTGVSGLGGVQGLDTQLAQLGLQGMQIGGNNMNNAARTQGAIAQNPNYTNQNAGYATALNSLFGSAAGGGGLLGGLGSGLSSLFGGGSSGSYNDPYSFTSNGGSLQNSAIGATAPSFDFSNIGNDASNLDLNFGNN
jgi:hypothetical protein